MTNPWPYKTNHCIQLQKKSLMFSLSMFACLSVLRTCLQYLSVHKLIAMTWMGPSRTQANTTLDTKQRHPAHISIRVSAPQ